MFGIEKLVTRTWMFGIEKLATRTLMFWIEKLATRTLMFWIEKLATRTLMFFKSIQEVYIVCSYSAGDTLLTFDGPTIDWLVACLLSY